MIISKSLKYYQDKARIDKANNQKTAYKIQFYNNFLIDEYVKSYNEGNPNKPATAVMWANLSILNKPEVYKNYNKIVNSRFTSNDNLFKMITKNKANKDLNRIVETEVNRISKNIDYTEQVLKKYEIPLKEYESFKNTQRNRSVANRQEILQQVAIKSNDLLVSEGLNINNNVFSYRNLETTAESLMRQSQMSSKHEEILSVNENYSSEGKDEPYKNKRWVWTGEGNTTRHESNNMQERKVEEPFVIVNDNTLEIDELMYPSDPAGSPSNVIICYCEVEYF